MFPSPFHISQRSSAISTPLPLLLPLSPSTARATLLLAPWVNCLGWASLCTSSLTCNFVQVFGGRGAAVVYRARWGLQSPAFPSPLLPSPPQIPPPTHAVTSSFTPKPLISRFLSLILACYGVSLPLFCSTSIPQLMCLAGLSARKDIQRLTYVLSLAVSATNTVI